jgi:hypothetical protein
VSLARLQRLADEDRSSVAVYLADRWIPQISSKRVGIVAKGITWDNQSILDEHLRLRNLYPDVKLLWSGDWSTYDGRIFWVTVVGLQSTDPDDVLGWCVQGGSTGTTGSRRSSARRTRSLEVPSSFHGGERLVDAVVGGCSMCSPADIDRRQGARGPSPRCFGTGPRCRSNG